MFFKRLNPCKYTGEAQKWHMHESKTAQIWLNDKYNYFFMEL